METPGRGPEGRIHLRSGGVPRNGGKSTQVPGGGGSGLREAPHTEPLPGCGGGALEDPPTLFPVPHEGHLRHEGRHLWEAPLLFRALAAVRPGAAGVPAALPRQHLPRVSSADRKALKAGPRLSCPRGPGSQDGPCPRELSAHGGVTKGRETPRKPRREAPAAAALLGAVHCLPHTSWSESPLCRRSPELEAERPRSQPHKDPGSRDWGRTDTVRYSLPRLPTTPASRSLSDGTAVAPPSVTCGPTTSPKSRWSVRHIGGCDCVWRWGFTAATKANFSRCQ